MYIYIYIYKRRSRSEDGKKIEGKSAQQLMLWPMYLNRDTKGKPHLIWPFRGRAVCIERCTYGSVGSLLTWSIWPWGERHLTGGQWCQSLHKRVIQVGFLPNHGSTVLFYLRNEWDFGGLIVGKRVVRTLAPKGSSLITLVNHFQHINKETL